MIFKKKLITDVSSEQIRNVTEILKENNLPYEMKTIVNRSSGSRTADAHLGQHYLNIPSAPNYIYIVYVNPKDYEKARSLTN